MVIVMLNQLKITNETKKKKHISSPRAAAQSERLARSSLLLPFLPKNLRAALLKVPF